MERLPCVVMVSLVFLVAASAAADPLIPPEGEEEPTETSSDVSTDDDYQTIVTSGRSERHVFDVDRSVYVIDAEAIEAEQSAGVLEAIASLPGVHQQRTNRGAGSPVLRGLVAIATLYPFFYFESHLSMISGSLIQQFIFLFIVIFLCKKTLLYLKI